MKHIWITGLVIMGYVQLLFGQSQENVSLALGNVRASVLRYHMLTSTSVLNEDVQSPESLQRQSGLKSPRTGILLSVVIPGAGEMYAGSWIKGACFLGVEALLWVGVAHFSHEGNKWEDVFHDYADNYWSEPEYWVGIAEEAGIGGVTTENYKSYLSELREYERRNYSHSLHEEKDQQYYEMIGKYNQFKRGWDDYQEEGPALTPHRDHYEGLRDKSNVQFKRASYSAMIILANHLLSALDASWTIRSKNKKIESGVRMGLEQVGDHFQWSMGLQIRY